MTDSFFKYLQYEKRLSKHTLVAYQSDIEQFQDFVKSVYETQGLSDATYSMVRSWIIDLTEKKVQAVSINRKIASLKAFYKFLLSQGTITTNPCDRIATLKTSKRLPSFVRESEMEKVLPEPTSGDFESIRDHLVLELFYSTGIRLSELIGLKDQAFNFADRTVKVLGKRNKERVVPYNKSLVDSLRNYVALRNREIGEHPEGYFFVTNEGKKSYPMLIYRIVKSRLLHSTTAERKSPHILRHTYATHLLDRGAELNAVKDLLGHSSLAATQVYTHNSIEKIKRVFELAHPKA
ncbi:MAG: tyrosine-type recombinase/integrase [Chryseolinea sp.]